MKTLNYFNALLMRGPATGGRVSGEGSVSGVIGRDGVTFLGGWGGMSLGGWGRMFFN